MQVSSSPHPSVTPTSPAAVPVAPAIHQPPVRRPVLAGRLLLGVGRPPDHKAVRPPQDAVGGTQAWVTRRHPPITPAEAMTAQEQVESGIQRALALTRQGPRPGSSFLPRKAGESPADFGARLRAALDAVFEVPGYRPETPRGRERLLAALVAHADELVLQPGMSPAQGVGLGPDGADHRHLFDALMQRLFRPLARTVTDGAAPAAAVPAALVEAFELLESPSITDHPRRTALVQQGMFALARAFGGERMSEATLNWLESLIFNGRPCEREPAWLRASLVGLTLGTSPITRHAGESNPVSQRAESLGLAHLAELSPRQIEALWLLPMPLDAAASYAPEQLGAMVVARRCSPGTRHGEPGLDHLHAKASSPHTTLSPAHLVAFGCAATRDHIGSSLVGDRDRESSLHRQWLPRYPEEARALWELGAKLARDPGRAWTESSLSEDERQRFFRVALDIVAPRPAQCAALLAAEGVGEETLTAILRSRPPEFAWAALPRLAQRVLEGLDDGAPGRTGGAKTTAVSKEASETLHGHEDTPTLHDSKQSTPGAGTDSTGRSLASARLLATYDVLAACCLAASRCERAGERDKVKEELARVESDTSGLGRMPELQRALAAKLAQLLVKLEASLDQTQGMR